MYKFTYIHIRGLRPPAAGRGLWLSGIVLFRVVSGCVGLCRIVSGCVRLCRVRTRVILIVRASISSSKYTHSKSFSKNSSSSSAPLAIRHKLHPIGVFRKLWRNLESQKAVVSLLFRPILVVVETETLKTFQSIHYNPWELPEYTLSAFCYTI